MRPGDGPTRVRVVAVSAASGPRALRRRRALWDHRRLRRGDRHGGLTETLADAYDVLATPGNATPSHRLGRRADLACGSTRPSPTPRARARAQVRAGLPVSPLLLGVLHHQSVNRLVVRAAEHALIRARGYVFAVRPALSADNQTASPHDPRRRQEAPCHGVRSRWPRVLAVPTRDPLSSTCTPSLCRFASPITLVSLPPGSGPLGSRSAHLSDFVRPRVPVHARSRHPPAMDPDGACRAVRRGRPPNTERLRVSAVATPPSSATIVHALETRSHLEMYGGGVRAATAGGLAPYFF